MKNKLMNDKLRQLVSDTYPNQEWKEDNILDISITANVFGCVSLRGKLEKLDTDNKYAVDGQKSVIFINTKIDIDREVNFENHDTSFICTAYVNSKYNICCLHYFKNVKF